MKPPYSERPWDRTKAFTIGRLPWCGVLFHQPCYTDTSWFMLTKFTCKSLSKWNTTKIKVEKPVFEVNLCSFSLISNYAVQIHKKIAEFMFTIGRFFGKMVSIWGVHVHYREVFTIGRFAYNGSIWEKIWDREKVFTIRRCSLYRGVHYGRFHCIMFLDLVKIFISM